MPTDEELARLAEAAILQEAKRGALRAELVGPSGWLKPKLRPTNKVFLHNTILGAVASNELKEKKRRRVRETRLEQFEEELRERKRYKRQYLRASTKEKDNKVPISKKPTRENVPSKSVNGISWKEDGDNEGLEISRSIPTVKKKKPPSISNCALPRNIKFVSADKRNQLGIT